MPSIPIWLTLVLLFIAANVIFVSVQNLWHANDRKRLDGLKAEIAIARSLVDEREAVIRQLGLEITRMEAQIESSSISLVDRNVIIARHNQRVAVYQLAYTDYSSSIDDLNRKIAEANSLSNKIGSTWYLIPVPRGSKRGANGVR